MLKSLEYLIDTEQTLRALADKPAAAKPTKLGVEMLLESDGLGQLLVADFYSANGDLPRGNLYFVNRIEYNSNLDLIVIYPHDTPTGGVPLSNDRASRCFLVHLARPRLEESEEGLLVHRE